MVAEIIAAPWQALSASGSPVRVSLSQGSCRVQGMQPQLCGQGKGGVQGLSATFKMELSLNSAEDGGGTLQLLGRSNAGTSALSAHWHLRSCQQSIEGPPPAAHICGYQPDEFHNGCEQLLLAGPCQPAVRRRELAHVWTARLLKPDLCRARQL